MRAMFRRANVATYVRNTTDLTQAASSHNCSAERLTRDRSSRNHSNITIAPCAACDIHVHALVLLPKSVGEQLAPGAA